MAIEMHPETLRGKDGQQPVWHDRPAEECARLLGADLHRGLTVEAAADRLRTFGSNAIAEGRRRTPLAILADQFKDLMILVLLAAAVISGIIGEPQDTIAIVVIVVLNAVIGFVQEFRAERAVAALRRMAAPGARVVRNGEVMEIPSRDLVPGDVVLLEAGNVVPADLRLAEAVRLKNQEAALTGESHAVDKEIQPLPGADLPLGDRRNMAFKGTVVSYGRGRGLVVATGMATELGKVAGLLAGEEEVRTPLQKRLARFGSRLAVAVLAVCAVVFGAGLLRGEPAALMFLTAVSLAVAAIPEALPAVVTVSLALGAYRMVKQHALIRRLPAVETLGSITYICSDKTGTLTQNHMHAEVFRVGGQTQAPEALSPPWELFFTALALCNDAGLTRSGKPSGEPTETALYEAAFQAGFVKPELEHGRPRIAELPFDSERKRMSTLHQDRNGILVFTKGAPETVLGLCRRRLADDGPVPMDEAELTREAEAMAGDGLRVLAVAYGNRPALPQPLEMAEDDLIFLGFVGLMDPPRREAQEAVAQCKAAGIVPVMITGDHPATARAIAWRLGIVEDGGQVMVGTELAVLDDEALRERARSVRVYARVDPAQKIRIVKVLQELGEYVAMTGDGVNDAPALKRADIGVSMGKIGTDVAREASHMVLLDDNFATIVHAVRAGRRIFDNIRKFIKYTMTSNSGEIWTIFLAPFLGLPVPLLPIHILWINLVTDGLPGLALAVEPEERGVMKRPPRSPRESIFAHGMWQHILWVGLLMGGVSLVTQAWAYHTGSAHWQSMVFTVLTLSQLGHALAVRTESASLFRVGLLSNRWLLGAVVLTVGLQLATLYVPVLNAVFKTQPLDGAELALCLALSTVVFWAVEIEKWLVRTGRLYREATPAGP